MVVHGRVLDVVGPVRRMAVFLHHMNFSRVWTGERTHCEYECLKSSGVHGDLTKRALNTFGVAIGEASKIDESPLSARNAQAQRVEDVRLSNLNASVTPDM